MKTQLKTMVKRFLTVCIFICFLLSSCNARKITLNEVKDVVPPLVEESKVLNEIYFGKGFKPDGEISNVRETGGYFYCVTSEYGLNSINEIKEATEKIFSLEYAKSIYEYAFEGIYFANMVASPRFSENEMGLMQSVNSDTRYLPKRTFDYDSMKITKEGRDRVTVSIPTTADGKKEVLNIAVVRFFEIIVSSLT